MEQKIDIKLLQHIDIWDTKTENRYSIFADSPDYKVWVKILAEDKKLDKPRYIYGMVKY